MDMVTGTQVSITRTVGLPRAQMWDLITTVDRIGEWSPETVAARWSDTAQLRPGARFSADNVFPGGRESTVTCVVTEADRPAVFAWSVLDDAGQVGSSWRYELRDGNAPNTTEVRHSFTHGPGNTGAREAADTDPRSLDQRLVTLCQNMTSTIAAMADSHSSMGATR